MTAPVIRAVFFDVGGTLIQPWPSIGTVYARIGAEFGFIGTAESMEQAFRAAWKLAKASQPGKLSTGDKGWWRELVFQVLAIQGIGGREETKQAYFEKLYQAFEKPDVWRIFPDVIPTLQAFRARQLHLGIISNWDGRLRPLLTALELTRYFDSITISCEVGVEKPDPVIFKTALQAAGVTAEQALHIGDSESEDGQGTAGVGMQFLLVRQSSADWQQVIDRVR